MAAGRTRRTLARLMLELGAGWAYYSLLFASMARLAGLTPINVMVEPLRRNMNAEASCRCAGLCSELASLGRAQSSGRRWFRRHPASKASPSALAGDGRAASSRWPRDGSGSGGIGRDRSRSVELGRGWPGSAGRLGVARDFKRSLVLAEGGCGSCLSGYGWVVNL